MSVARSAHTEPELALRSALHKLGLRFRVQRPVDQDRRRRVDIAFPRERVAVFIDGCFWHRCPTHATFPRANAEFWRAKLERNVERDRDTDVQLDARGWTVMRFWEHEDPESAADRIEKVIRAARSRQP